MFISADLPETIPLFPLPGALLLPRTRLPLNIFEPRYLAMLEDTLKTSHRLIGMIQPLGVQTEKASDQLHAIGCAGRVVAFSETDDGRYMITLHGVSRFRVTRTPNGFTPYIKSDVDWADFASDLKRPKADLEFDRGEFMQTLSDFFQSSGLSSDWDSLEKADDELLINSLSMLCPFGVEDKQALLESPSLRDRRETLVTLMKFSMASSQGEEPIQ